MRITRTIARVVAACSVLTLSAATGCGSLDKDFYRSAKSYYEFSAPIVLDATQDDPDIDAAEKQAIADRVASHGGVIEAASELADN